MGNWSSKRIDNWGAAAGALVQMCQEARAKQTAWLATIGMTWEAAMAIKDPSERAALEARYAIHNA